jgi:monoamine oxidase
MDYDVLIVGSGMAGLHTALELQKEFPRLSIALFEKYKVLGGRTFTFHGTVDKHPVQWEEGAGRISESHTRLLALLKRYKLTYLPISSAIHYKDSPQTPIEDNWFEPSIPVVLEPLLTLPPEDLAKSTIRQLLTKIHGPSAAEKLLLRFPYRSEVDVMRADMALDLFAHEMKTHEGYGICKEGFSALVDSMRADFVQRGGTVFPHHQLVRVEEGAATFLVGPPSDGTSRSEKVVSAGQIVVALPSSAVEKIDGLTKIPVLRHLRMEPLVRFYAVFPLQKPMWYESYGRVVCRPPVRYLLPGNPAQGVCQISYTDARDAETIMKMIDEHGEKKTGDFLIAELRKLLSHDIPTPTLYKTHVWKNAVTYWLPGDYDPATESRQSVHPLPDTMPSVWLCGESYSVRQGWIEGALEQAERMMVPLRKKLGRK